VNEEIKNTTRNMLQPAKKVAPLTLMLCSGKEEFEKMK